MSLRSARPSRRPPRSNLNTYVSLGFLVLMLTMILLLKGQVADSAAGCFTRLSEPPEEEQIVVPQGAGGETGNVRVMIPDADVLNPELLPAEPDVMVRGLE